MSPKFKRYPREFQMRVAREFLTSDKTLEQIAIEFGVCHNSVSRWRERYASQLPQPSRTISMPAA